MLASQDLAKRYRIYQWRQVGTGSFWPFPSVCQLWAISCGRQANSEISDQDIQVVLLRLQELQIRSTYFLTCFALEPITIVSIIADWGLFVRSVSKLNFKFGGECILILSE